MHELNRAILRSRYHITGLVAMDTALHIGGGRELSTITDSPVVRTVTGEPFIPGSSIKGAFRAAVERLLPALEMRTCQLDDGHPDCLSTNCDMSRYYNVLRQQKGRTLAADEDTKKTIEKLQAIVSHLDIGASSLTALGWPDWCGHTITDEHLLALLDALLCESCKTFGSVHLVSAAIFHDLPVDGEWYEAFQVRDGVGIDRDSERAREQVKYDFEVVPPQTVFKFALTLENPRDRDLQLVALGLQEFIQGMVPIGGIRSRGLGRCHLEDLTVRYVDFTKDQARKDYLVSGKMTEQDGKIFIAGHVATLVGV
ncbi:MAG: RAMP superfamily CRISPR-associated protein [Gammaproteobacteria bacterium]|nr:RAMP superfamily CRISPR-associated protein [Gammaproteobacteria bacterium]